MLTRNLPESLEVPHEVIIELHTDCNLNCDFCYNKNSNSTMPAFQVCKILDQLYLSNIKAVRFTGGEPLLRSDLSSILAYAKSKHLYVILNTNATLFNSDNIDLLAYVDSLLVSFHLLNEFNLLKEKLCLIKRLSKKPYVMMATVATSSNIKKLNEFYKSVSSLLAENLIDEWFILRQLPTRDNATPVPPSEMYILIDKIHAFNRKYKLNAFIANALPFCFSGKENIQKVAQISTGGFFDSGYSRLYVCSDGRVKPDYSSNYVLGHIDTDLIMDIWNLDYLKQLRNYKYVKEKCKTCDFLRICKGGLVSEKPDYLLKNDLSGNKSNK